MSDKKIKTPKQVDASPFVSSIISDHLRDPAFQKMFKEYWTSSLPFQSKDFELITEPFRVCRIFNFLKNQEFIQDLKKQIQEMGSDKIMMDLYQFEQTNDFVNTKEGCVKTLRDTFLAEMKQWMQVHTGIELNDSLSMSSSMYYNGDYLLCHDDNNEDRRIAFILYLNEYWSKENGGDLALFDTDEYKQPKDVVKRISPEYNCLLFFEVTQVSYHQVLEVLTTEKCRFSINGWFHGPLPEGLPAKPLRPSPITCFENLWFDYTFIDFWVKHEYLTRSVGDKINKQFKEDSIAFLSNFFKSDQYSALNDNIRDENIKWIKMGPPDVRNFEVANLDTLPDVLRNFVNFLKSTEFLTLINWFTDGDIVPEEDVSKQPAVTIEIQRWSKGSYSLIDPDESKRHTYEAINAYGNCSTEDYLETVPEFYDINKLNNDISSNNGSSARNDNVVCEETDFSLTNQNVSDANNSSDDEDSPTRKRKSDSDKSKRLSDPKRTRKSSETPDISQDEEKIEVVDYQEVEIGDYSEEVEVVCEKLLEPEEEFEEDAEEEDEEAYEQDIDTFEETLVKSDSVKEVERKIKIYETAMWMIENKKVVIPLKEDFKNCVKDREKFYMFIQNYQFDIEDTKRLRDDLGVHCGFDDYEQSDDLNDLLLANSKIINDSFEVKKKELEPVINGILEAYSVIESGRCPSEKYKDSEYEVLSHDPYESIVSVELEKTKNGRKLVQVERLKLPGCSLEVVIPLNPLMNRQEEQTVYYVDPFVENLEEAVEKEVPLKYNHVSVVDKQRHISRVHKYISNSVSHMSYTIVITIYEKQFNLTNILKHLVKPTGK